MIHQYHHTPIFYSISGSGPALVLLHGFLESSTMWTYFVPELSKNYTVISIDLPGHGKTGVVDRIHSMELMADVVFDILKERQITVASFIGHSMGGYVALAFAELFPEVIDSLILLNSTTQKDSDDRKFQRDRAINFMEQQKDTIVSLAIANLFTEEARSLYASEIEKLKMEALQFSSQGLVATIKGMRDRKDRTHVLKQFNKKKRIICGSADPIVPLSNSQRISESTSTEIIILNGSHMSWIENRDELVKIMHFVE